MGDILKSAISPRSCCNNKQENIQSDVYLIISKKLIFVTSIQRLVIGSCKHDVIELGQLSQRYEQTTKKSLLSQLSQLFRPWTVGTMDCPNVLNRLVGTWLGLQGRLSQHLNILRLFAWDNCPKSINCRSLYLQVYNLPGLYRITQD